MATAFFKMSRSIRSRSFSRRSREISAAGSGTECGADAGIGRGADPASRPPLPLRQFEPQKIPLVMSPAETRRLLAVASNLKVRTLLSLGYGCGLRASEVV